eukprot:TRINITY_DN17_c0_g3_i1.p1 TRINITY_DN17_c0_g3~~TRINITY_DN17_c0_g3_i1.p1  ORF type:complete len:191 (-),score=52.94 TRINITY_DN17_c0_g3_i1:23-595(-)
MTTHTKLDLVLLGDGGVGKSAVTVQLTEKQFIAVYDPTIENTFRKQLEVDGRIYLLNILDTAGQEEYEAMRAQYIRSGVGFLIVYSITSPKSLSKAEDIHNLILRVKDADQWPCVICGNKADLNDQRQVEASRGQALADKIGGEFFETSAKTGQNIQTAFEALVRITIKDMVIEEEDTGKRRSRSGCVIL